MFTVCPKCALTLVVTAADLRVAQGYVRCGRCSSVFNALAQLSDERAAAAAAAAAPPAPEEPAEPPESEEPSPPPAPAGPREGQRPETPARRAADEDPIPDDALEFNPASTDVSSLFVEPPPNPEWTAATGSFKALAAAAREPVSDPAPTDPASFDLELDAALLSDIMDSGSRPAPPATAPPRETKPAPKAPASPAAAPPQRAPAPDAAARATAPARPRGVSRPRPVAETAIAPAGDTRLPVRETPPPVRATPPATPDAGSPELTSSLSGDEAAAEDSASFAAPVAPRAVRAALPWAIGAALLIVLLPLQIIDHERDALATNARFSQPLTRFYSMLGVRLMPRWDLNAYDIHQLGAMVEPGSAGAITVRASIRNVGARAQPPPLLRVTLEDRFGNRLASREVSPRDYLPGSLTPPALMAVDQRIDAELAFVDPGANAVGFVLDACLPARGGGVACANDASVR